MHTQRRNVNEKETIIKNIIVVTYRRNDSWNAGRLRK